jgi:hypothetical protein
LKALFEVLAGPAAQPSAPGICFGRYRTVAFDGITSIKVPDTARNRSWLGKMKAALGVTGYPVTPVETGTRALLGAVFGPPATGETGYARQHRRRQPHRPHRPGRPGQPAAAPPPRVSARKVKSPLSRWNKADPNRPRRSTPVTALTITVSGAETTTQSATHQDQCLTAAPGP